MRTTQQLKEEIYQEVENSGFYKNVQAQVKAHVLEIIDKETNTNKNKLGFQYEHPLLSKLKKYPLTSLCMDLIQEFLESFKFKHTLNVFKKEINRTMNMNRANLTKQFNIDLSGKDQAVLLGIVSQLSSGDVKIVQKNVTKDKPHESRKNNFINEDVLKPSTEKDKEKQKKKKEPFYYEVQEQKTQQTKAEGKKEKSNKFYEIDEKSQDNSQSKSQSQSQSQSQSNMQFQEPSQSQSQIKSSEESKIEEVLDKKKDKKKEEKKEGATDLLEDVMGKFIIDKEEKKKSSEEEFKARKAFSEEKKKKEVAPEESGANKIRGISAGKGISGMGSMNTFMKFSTFNQQPKNESNVDEEFDELQQSRDSTRRNPLFSSSESGFDRSMGFDQSVDSNAIEDYEYIERAKKFKKRF